MSKRKTVLFLILLLVGLGILSYPALSNFVNQRHGSYAIEELQEHLENADIAEQRRLAEAYNSRLLTAQGEIDEEEYNAILNFSDGMMGYLQIPKINVNLPIYHDVTEEILAKGVGHLPQSAFPIGGTGNHSVLTGHTGLTSAELFTDLTELTEGDTFYITILDGTLAYQVDQIKVVLPSEGQDLAAVPDQDYCTLVTCTPYGVNSHRLLVRGHRIELQQETVQQLQTEVQKKTLPLSWLIILAILYPLLIILLFFIIRKRRK